MMEFSYYLEFYKRNIFNMDTDENTKLLEKNGKQAFEIEKYFCKNILNIEELRNTIIKSYVFEKDLDFESRINYIKGIIYSKKYINANDVEILSRDLQDVPTEHIYDSIFFDMGYSYNEEEFFELIDGVDDNNIKMKERLDLNNDQFIKKQDFPILIGNNVSSDEDEDDYDSEDDEEINEDECGFDDEEEIDIYKLISIDQKLILFKENYERFKTAMLEKHGININSNTKCNKYVIKGMDDWFNHIFYIMESLYETHKNISKMKSLDLSDFI